MFTVTETTTIALPIEQVFAFIADARNRPQWDESVITEQLTSPLPIGVGTTVHSRLTAMGKAYDYDWRVTEFQAPTRMVIVSTAGPLPTTLTFELATSATATHLTATIAGHPAGAMRMIQPLLARSTLSNLARGLARLAPLLERVPGAQFAPPAT